MRVVKEFDWGVYVLQLPDGRFVADTDNNFLSISSREHDIAKISELMRAARAYGIDDAKPVFLPGRRKISQAEFETQWERLLAGQIPDPNDPGVLMDIERGDDERQNR